MRKWTLLFFGITLCYVAQTQVSYAWDFNELPTNAIVSDLDGATDVLEPAGWFIKEIGAGTGHFAISSSGLNSSVERGPVNHWLIIPDLEIGNESILSCEFRASSSSTEKFKLLISTNGLDYYDFEPLSASYTFFGLLGKIHISLDEYAGQTVHLALVHHEEEAGSFWLDNLMIESNAQSTETSSSNVVSRIDYPYVFPGTFDVEMQVINDLDEAINSISVNYTMDGGETIETVTASYVNNVNERCYFTIPELLTFDEPGIYEILIWTSNPNGIPETNLSDDRRALQVVVLEETAPRKVVLEEFTADWCGYCTRAPLFLQEVLDSLGEENMALATFHGGDTELELPVFADLVNAIPNLVNAFPTGSIDRYRQNINLGTVAMAPEFWMENIARALDHPTSVNISADIDYSMETRAIDVNLNVDFINEDRGVFKVHAYLTENRVVGYPQSNFYNETMEYPALYNLGNPIENYAHDHVVRHVLTPSLGDDSFVPMSVVAGDHFEQTYSYQIPEEFVVDHMQLVVYITKNPLDNSDVEQFVLNAEDYTFSQFLVNVEETTLDHSIKIYPNPASDYLNVQFTGSAPDFIKIIAMDGREIITIRNIKNYSLIDISQINPGIYSLVSYKGESSFHQRLIIE